MVGKLRTTGIEIVTGAEVAHFDWGRLTTWPTADARSADRVVALPRDARARHSPGCRWTRTASCSATRGRHRRGRAGRARGRRRRHLPASSEGGIACQQADSVAASIARANGFDAETPRFPPLDGGRLLGDGASGLRWPVPKVTGRFLAPFLRDLTAGPAGLTRSPPADP